MTTIQRLPTGYSTRASGLAVPDSVGEPVPANKLRAGLADARKQIDSAMNEVVKAFAGDFEIQEIELTASFSADGKFLGFGVGGSASLKITGRKLRLPWPVSSLFFPPVSAPGPGDVELATNLCESDIRDTETLGDSPGWLFPD
jgi:hypothetical protein